MLKISNNQKLTIKLGTGESGKSTVAKQLRIINQKAWTDEERMEYKPLVYRNIISSLQTILSNASKANVVFDVSNEVSTNHVFN